MVVGAGDGKAEIDVSVHGVAVDDVGDARCIEVGRIGGALDGRGDAGFGSEEIVDGRR